MNIHTAGFHVAKYSVVSSRFAPDVATVSRSTSIHAFGIGMTALVTTIVNFPIRLRMLCRASGSPPTNDT